MVLRVGDHRELQAAVLALRLMNRTLASDVNRSTKALLDPIWKEAVARNAVTRVDQRVIVQGTRVKAGNPPVAIAASSVKPLSGGLVPANQWPVIEFGGFQNKVTTYSRRGTSVTRHTARQIPRRVKSGRIAYKALAEVTPRVVSLWVQMIVAKSAEALGVNHG